MSHGRHTKKDDDPNDRARARDEAADAFDTIRARLEEGDTIALDELCRSRPDLKPALEKRYADWSERRDAASRTASSPPTDSGSHERSVTTTATHVDAQAWRRFLSQLRTRGPTYTRYRFVTEIGRGGMGIVHKVFDQDAQRTLALKVLRPQDGDEAADAPTPVDEKTLGRFLEEAQVTSQLDHPNIVPVHEIGVDEQGRVYFTMKLVKGDDLRRVFEAVRRNDSEMSLPRVISILQKVCEAMSYAHAKGVIHRDLKPGNVMVGRYGEVYVMDWGLARVLDRPDAHDLRIRKPDDTATKSRVRTARGDGDSGSSNSPIVTMDGDVVGTPSYMPPEQASGEVEKLGPWSDVYAVGAMLYHLIAGCAPYQHTSTKISAWAVLAELSHGPPPPLRTIAKNADPELIAICEKAMQRDLTLRYPSMIELASDLRAFVESRVVSAYESGLLAELRKWLRRNRALAVTALSAAFLLTALATYSVFKIQAERNAAIDSADKASESARLAERRRIEAEREKQKVQWVLNLVRIGDLKKQWIDLWPAEPSRIRALEEWIARSEELLAAKPEYSAKILELTAVGTALRHPQDDDNDRLRAAIAALATGVEGMLPDLKDPAARAARLSELRTEASNLAASIESEREYDFGADDESAWWLNHARTMLRELASLELPDEQKPTIASVRARLEFAKSVTRRTIEEPKALWDETIAAIANSPHYGGLRISPQLGLIPLGPSPQSGFFEFAHLQSGEPARRDPARGDELVVSPETGIVFVLIPGGVFEMGAQRDDPESPNFDPEAEAHESPTTTVELAPYFLSKYELTQGQWRRIRGDNPSNYVAGRPFHPKETVDDRHPVEMVSWNDCSAFALRLGSGVMLPTEAQWEYACRAGSSSPFWTGGDLTGLDKVANLADSFLLTHGGLDQWLYDRSLNDGFAGHAPVGAFQPNRFGLYDVIGNVREWCRDSYTSYSEKPRPRDGERIVEFEGDRVLRGGCWDGIAKNSRSAQRLHAPPAFAVNFLGVRLAREIQP